MDIKFDFDDILITADITTDIQHRCDIDIFDENDFLPLFTAPMDTVINQENCELFKKVGIIPILPRTEKNLIKNEWIALGLLEFEERYLNNTESEYMKVLLDVANGHMNQVLNLTIKSKQKYGNKLTLMVGNIANPKTYTLLSDAGADYVRAGVGNGGGCWIAGSKIKTQSGYKNVENVNTDDKVLTHTGEYKDVILTHELNYDEDLIDINGNISTKDHLYYVINKNDAGKITDNNYQDYAIWIEAEKLDNNYLILEMGKND